MATQLYLNVFEQFSVQVPYKNSEGQVDVVTLSRGTSRGGGIAIESVQEGLELAREIFAETTDQFHPGSKLIGEVVSEAGVTLAEVQKEEA